MSPTHYPVLLSIEQGLGWLEYLRKGFSCLMKEELCWRHAHPCGLSAVAELFTLLKAAEEMKMKRTDEVHFGQ